MTYLIIDLVKWIFINMTDKLKSLKLSLLLKELKLLDSEKEYIDEFTNHYKPIFMDELSKNGYKPKIITGETKNNISDTINKKIIEVSEDELKTIKTIFRTIAKICHPDKTKNLYRNKLYDQAQVAYEINDLLSLYRITKKLNISVDLTVDSLILFEKIVVDKKKELKEIGSSFLWLWVNETNDEKKMEIINKFIKTHG